MARSVLDIILSLKGDKATRELKKVDKSLGKVDRSAKKSVGALGKLDAKFALMAGGAGLAAAGVVKLGQAIWNLGKRGAAVEQTGESFDFLLDKLEGAPDLLADTRKEFRGTVDDMTIMSSIMTLTAGTTDDLGKAFLEAAPKLAEIAKAANKLNPTMGDTAFMFDSITAGIKRNSRQILDNLGIVFSSAEAQKEYAESIGKSVDQLTENELVFSTLNAAMKAGNNLIDQVGGNVDSATDAMARAEIAAKNLGDSWSKFAAKLTAEVAPPLTQILDGINENTEANEAFSQALDDGIVTMDDWRAELDRINRGALTAAQMMEWLESKTEEYNEEIERVTSGLEYSKEAQRDFNWAMLAGAEATDEADKATEEYAKRMNWLNQESADAITTLRGLLDLKIKDFFDVDMGIGNVAAQMFDITNFKEFGGEALEIMVHEVQAGLAQGKITPEQAREFFKNIAVEAEAIKVQMGEIDASEAAESISEDFNIPMGEARGLVDDVLEGIDLVNSADISAITGEFDALEERRQKLMEAGEIPLEADPQDEAQQALDGLQEQVDLLTDEPWIIEFQIVTTGKMPSGSTTTTKTTHPDHGAQHGADFVVPPGYPDDTYPMRVTTGEHVTVTPAGQQQRGATTYTQNVTQHFHSEGAAALGMAIVRKFGRDRLNASMGR